MANFNLDVQDGPTGVLIDVSWEAVIGAGEKQQATTLVDVSTLQKHWKGGACNGLIIQEIQGEANIADVSIGSDNEAVFLLDSKYAVISTMDKFNKGFGKFYDQGGLRNTNAVHTGNNTGDGGNGDLLIACGVKSTSSSATPAAAFTTDLANAANGSFYRLKIKATKTFDV